MVAPVYISVFVVGLTEISLEIAAISGFQSLYGYVYNQVALIVAAFMAGLVVGGRLGVSAARGGWGLGGFVLLQAGMALVPLGLWGAIARIAELPPGALAAWSHAFPALVVAAAVLAGVQFPLAARLCPASRTEPGAAGGRLHGMDLTGAAVGAPLTAVFLLPVLGLRDAMAALAILNCGALAALMVSAALLPRRR
jgi:predicted membrane-bound spermidine synthase